MLEVQLALYIFLVIADSKSTVVNAEKYCIEDAIEATGTVCSFDKSAIDFNQSHSLVLILFQIFFSLLFSSPIDRPWEIPFISIVGVRIRFDGSGC